MENENVLDGGLTGGIIVNDVAKRAFSETGSWGKFFAVLGFIVSGFMVIAAFAMMFVMGSIGDSLSGAAGLSSGIGVGIGLLYLLLAALYIMPCLYLWRFSSKIKTSINTNDQDQFAEAIVNLKSCYKFFGIMTIVMIAFYIIAIIAAGVMGISGF